MYYSLDAIINALNAFAIFPDFDNSANGLTLEASPPTTTLVVRCKPESKITCFTCAADNLGYCERINAANPATAGAAIEVPLIALYSFSGKVE